MAVLTIQSTAVLSGLKPDDRIPGALLCRTGIHSVVSAGDANSVIQLVPIPKGARIIDIHVYIADAGAGRTCDIGDGGSTARFFADLAVNAGPLRKSLKINGVTVAPYEYTADDTIDVLWKVDTLEAGQRVMMNVFYTMGDVIADE
jgi:hypothetical protein